MTGELATAFGLSMVMLYVVIYGAIGVFLVRYIVRKLYKRGISAIHLTWGTLAFAAVIVTFISIYTHNLSLLITIAPLSILARRYATEFKETEKYLN